MSNRIRRRQFLAGAALGAGTAGVALLGKPTLVGAEPSTSGPKVVMNFGNKPYFYWGGILVGSSPDGDLVLLSNFDGKTELTVTDTPDSFFWRGVPIAKSGLQVGDNVFLQCYKPGVVNPRSTAIKAWANQGWVRGKVSTQDGPSYSVETDNGSRVVVTNTATQYGSSPAVGDYTECLGMFTPNGELVANRVWAYSLS